MSKQVLYTKFGTAKVNNKGYYQITSVKEGYFGKLLHRLIFEEFYNIEIPKKYVIHHKNGNKKDNCILNLQLMRLYDHSYLHNKGKKLSEEHKQKISKAHIGKIISKETKQKISEFKKGKKLSKEHRQKISDAKIGKKNWMYGKTHTDKVKKKISDANKGRIVSDETKRNISKSKNTEGYFRVSKHKCNSCKQGFRYRYSYVDETGKQKEITSININKLEKKVKSKGLEWFKINNGEL